MNNWIQVSGGVAFDLDNPTVDMIDIENIAHSLSNLCRFGGHCNKFYSVAEHSYNCWLMAPDDLKKEALLHDATEAYLIDLPTPLKNMFANYRELEDKIDLIIREKFNLPLRQTPMIKTIDKRMLMTEKGQLMDKAPMGWAITNNPYPNFDIKCWEPQQAYNQFMTAWNSF